MPIKEFYAHTKNMICISHFEPRIWGVLDAECESLWDRDKPLFITLSAHNTVAISHEFVPWPHLETTWNNILLGAVSNGWQKISDKERNLIHMLLSQTLWWQILIKHMLQVCFLFSLKDNWFALTARISHPTNISYRLRAGNLLLHTYTLSPISEKMWLYCNQIYNVYLCIFTQK